ncbi:hypothetical protein GMDG_04646, partial [Pseudogymnoascus destructans 20631-21]
MTTSINPQQSPPWFLTLPVTITRTIQSQIQNMIQNMIQTRSLPYRHANDTTTYFRTAHLPPQATSPRHTTTHHHVRNKTLPLPGVLQPREVDHHQEPGVL